MADQANPSPKGGPSKIIFIVLFIVLIGGGIGAWLMLRSKPNDGDGSDSGTGDDKPGGRKDESAKVVLDPTVLATLLDNNNNSFQQTGPMYIKSQEAQDLIKDKAISLQGNTRLMDFVRAKYDIGIGFSKLAQGQKQAVYDLFGQMDGVNLAANRPYLTFPVWGTYETIGATLRSQLQSMLGMDKVKFTLHKSRHEGNPWFLPSVSLNLLIGTRDASTWTAHEIWDYKAKRKDIDFFKRMNTLWKSDLDLLKPESPPGTFLPAWYWAGPMLQFVKIWIDAIDRLDKVTEWEAIRFLTAPLNKGGNAVVFTYTDPDTNADVSGEFDPGDENTNDDNDPIVLIPD